MRAFPLLLAAALLGASAARADSFLGGDWTTGSGYRGFDAKGGLAFDADDARELDATYSYAHSVTGTESRSRELVLTYVRNYDPAWTSRAGVSGWRDSLNNVDFFGPSWGFTYASYDDPASKDRAERFLVSFDNDLFVYKADETTTPRTIRFTRTASVTIPGGQSSVTLAQWRPYAHLEVPFFDGAVSPSIDYGHMFYSKDPALIEARSGRPRFSASANSLNGLTGGLNSDTAAAGVYVKLPFDFRLTGSLGVARSATDNSWATTQGAGLAVYLGERLKASTSWSRTIQGGVPADLFTSGGTIYF